MRGLQEKIIIARHFKQTTDLSVVCDSVIIFVIGGNNVLLHFYLAATEKAESYRIIFEV